MAQTAHRAQKNSHEAGDRGREKQKQRDRERNGAS